MSGIGVLCFNDTTPHARFAFAPNDQGSSDCRTGNFPVASLDKGRQPCSVSVLPITSELIEGDPSHDNPACMRGFIGRNLGATVGTPEEMPTLR